MHLRRLFKFGLVGGTGLVVNTLLLAAATELMGVHYLAGAAIATQGSTAWNFLLTNHWVFDDRYDSHRSWQRFGRFWIINNIALLARGPAIWLLTAGLGVHYLVSNLVTLAALMVVRYLLADSWIWGSGRSVGSHVAFRVDGDVEHGRSRATESGASRASSDGADRRRLFRRRSSPVSAYSPGRHGRTREPVSKTWSSRLTLIVILGLAAGLRTVGIAEFGFNSDESVYAGQGAALVGEEPYGQFFSLFRAHPLLLQLMVGTVFKVFGVSDASARLLVAMFGVGCVVLVYLLGTELFTRRVGLVSAAFLASMPYHVLISRQVLVDVPMAFFGVLSLLLLVIGLRRSSQALLLFAVLSAGLAALSKEVAVLLPIAIILYLTLTRAWSHVNRSTVIVGAFLYALAVAAFPISRLLGPSGNSTGFAVWQFSRPPNHSADYFLRILYQFAGVPLLILGGLGLIVMVVRRRNEDVLVVTWLAVFMVFFQLWPTKLFFYLMIVVPALAIAAALGIDVIIGSSRRLIGRLRPWLSETGVLAAAVAAFVLFGAIFSWQTATTAEAQPTGIRDFDIEVQSFAGGREFAEWARINTPEGSRFVTMGPSLGNILRFYGHRDSVALSVSPDPTRRNPAYVPVPNPDLAIREMAVHYLVWDAYTADRSVFYSDRLLRYVDSFQATAVYSVYVEDSEIIPVSGFPPDGADVRVVVYDVPGGNPTPIEADR